MKIIPVEDRLLIELIEDQPQDYVLPEGVEREKFRIGKVLDWGPDVKIPKNKTVLFERYGPLHLKQFNEKWFLVKQQYVLAILENE